jgi:diaminohydroxyphosphoribosylaminopyrimidine deaminase/5-amino-6-(5-phosphoribosylamino)uracil reductase
MRRALDIARNGLGTTHPNPMVGALVVAGGQIVGEGWHERAGGAHAEVNALAAAGEKARGATLYVTLEPCSTFGRTPPCTDAIQRAGIARVVAGARDPNPLHAGRGYDILRATGIAVTEGVLAEECEDQNLIFNFRMREKRPLFAAKAALSLDGKLAARTGASRWITGEAARENVHVLRRYYPAIGAGAGTVLADNPRFTARLPGKEQWCPRRFVFDRTLRTAEGTELPLLYSDSFHALTTVVTQEGAPAGARTKLEKAGVNVLTLPAGTDGEFWAAFSGFLAKEELWGILIEGGPKIFGSLLTAGKIDYLYAYQAPLLFADAQAPAAFGGLAPSDPQHAPRLNQVRHEVFGEDMLTRGWLVRP